MILFHCDSNTILQAPFKTKAKKHRLAAYNSIWGRLKSLGHKVSLQILDKNPAQSINGSSQKNGVHDTNWSPKICIAAMRPSVPSAYLKLNFWPP